MKIIGGRLQGQTIPVKASPHLRPTTDLVREALFNILDARPEFDWTKLKVLDLFAGSGALGLEAISRGAPKVVFVDDHYATARRLRETVKTLGVEEQATIHCKGVLSAISQLSESGERFDLVLMDPPYREGWIVAVLNRIHEAPLLNKGALLVSEHDKRELISPSEGFWNRVDSRRYGDSTLSFFEAL